MLDSDVALIGGTSTKPGSSYYALMKAAPPLSLPTSLLLQLGKSTHKQAAAGALGKLWAAAGKRGTETARFTQYIRSRTPKRGRV